MLAGSGDIHGSLGGFGFRSGLVGGLGVSCS